MNVRLGAAILNASPRDLGEQLSYALQVIVCQAPSCRTEIVLPFLSPLENFPLVPSVGGDPSLM